MSRQLKGKQYDKAALENAVHAVRTKSMGYLKASKLYGVPRTTIYDKIVGKSSVESYQGSPTLLSVEEESRLVKWLEEMSKIGYGRSKQELLDVVQKIIREDGRPNRCKDSRPGKDWYYGFMKRHPTLSLRSPRQLGKERAVINPERVIQWFTDFQTYIRDTVADHLILLDPTRLYNADETGFSVCPKTDHVLGIKGAKSVYNLTASDKSQITVMAGMSAAAHYLRPMIVFAGQRFTRNMLEGFDDAVLGRSDNGWMDSELFVMWLKTVFIPDIEQRQVKKPVILFVDGHKTHMTLEASDVCKENGAILYCLLEHASHLMQPCDLRLFSSLKETWKSSLREWQIDHVAQYVTKFEFASIFKNAWVNASKVENAVNGFRDAGLFPLNKDKVIQTDKFQTSILFTRKDNMNTVQSEIIPSKLDTVKQVAETLQITEKEGYSDTEKQYKASTDKENTDPNKTNYVINSESTTENGLGLQQSTSGAELSTQPSASGAELPMQQSILGAESSTQPSTSGVEPTTQPSSSGAESSMQPSTPGAKSSMQPSTSGAKSSMQPLTSGAESPMSKILKILKPKTPKKRNFKREILPKAITGEEFRKILMEKKEKKGGRGG